MKIKIHLVHLEGPDGIGKSTLAKNLGASFGKSQKCKDEILKQGLPHTLLISCKYPSFNIAELDPINKTLGAMLTNFLTDFLRGERQLAMQMIERLLEKEEIEPIEFVILYDRSFMSTAVYQAVMARADFCEPHTIDDKTYGMVQMIYEAAFSMWSDKNLAFAIDRLIEDTDPNEPEYDDLKELQIEADHTFLVLKPEDVEKTATRIRERAKKGDRITDEVDKMVDGIADHLEKLSTAYDVAMDVLHDIAPDNVTINGSFNDSFNEAALHLETAALLNSLFNREIFECNWMNI